MIVYAFRLDRKGMLGVLDSKRAVDRVAQQIHQEVAVEWHEKHAPRHFEPSARNVYKYQARSMGYQKAKERAFQAGRKYGGQPVAEPATDLVLSGFLRETVLRYAMVRAFPTRFSVRMHGPRYAGMRPMKARNPNLGAEITRVTGREADEFTRMAKARLPVLMKQETRTYRSSWMTGTGTM